MRNKFFALFIVFAFALNGAGTVLADAKTDKKAKQTNALAALLPASDGVVTVDMTRLLSEAAPQILSGKPQILADINRTIDNVREKTGLDLRQFEQVVIGVSTKQNSAQEIDLEPVALIRGKYDANALVALGKLASNGKYREERVGDRTIYVFSGKEIIERNKPQTKNSMVDNAIDRMMKGLSKEFAVASYDANTLVFGSLARVRETFESKARVNAEILGLINRKPNATISFGAKLPNGLSNYLKLDNDEIGKSLDSLRMVSGALEISNNNATVSISAKTTQAESAKSVQKQLEDLQAVGKMLLGGAKGEDKKVFARMLDNARITRSLNEVMLDLQVPQSDINILLGVK